MLVGDHQVGIAVEKWLYNVTKAARDERCAGEVIVREIFEDLSKDLVGKSFHRAKDLVFMGGETNCGVQHLGMSHR